MGRPLIAKLQGIRGIETAFRGLFMSIRRIALLLLLASPSAFALEGLPPAVTLPPDVLVYDAASVVQEEFAEVEFTQADGQNVASKGRHWRSYLKWQDSDNKPVAQTWPAWLAALKAGGWTLVADYSEGRGHTLRKSEGGKELWLSLAMGDYDSPVLELIEVAGAAPALKLTPPAAKPETIADDADFPYLGKPAGAVLADTGVVNEPLDVTAIGADREAQLVGQGYRIKRYSPPASLSKLAFETSYRAALEQAGWTVKPADGGKPGEGHVVAHYSKQGRNLWAVLGRGNDNSNTGLSFAVADLGAEDWSARLKKDCRLPLYGLNFDFNKATLQADAAPVLEKLLVLLKSDAALAVEIQGHTDNVGGDAYNQKLSEARAKTVLDWLVVHGIAANRLSSQGYGLKQPLADNASDAGRARNRRVEIALKGCIKR